MTYTIALAQIDPVLGDLRKNVATHVEAVERAHAAGAALVVFPELSLTGYSVRDMNGELAINPSRDNSELRPLIEASKAGISILAGGIEENSEFKILNSSFLIEGGAVSVAHQKVYLPTYGMFEEMRYFSAGRTVRAIDTNVGRIGVLICEDLWHISLPYLMALDGAQLIVGMSASPTRVGPGEEEFGSARVNRENHRVYARLLSVYVAFCNRVGYEDGVNFWGGSQVVGPDGHVVAEGKILEKDLVLAELSDANIRKARRASRHFLDEDDGIVSRELIRRQQLDARK